MFRSNRATTAIGHGLESRQIAFKRDIDGLNNAFSNRDELMIQSRDSGSRLLGTLGPEHSAYIILTSSEQSELTLPASRPNWAIPNGAVHGASGHAEVCTVEARVLRERSIHRVNDLFREIRSRVRHTIFSESKWAVDICWFHLLRVEIVLWNLIEATMHSRILLCEPVYFRSRSWLECFFFSSIRYSLAGTAQPGMASSPAGRISAVSTFYPGTNSTPITLR